VGKKRRGVSAPKPIPKRRVPPPAPRWPIVTGAPLNPGVEHRWGAKGGPPITLRTVPFGLPSVEQRKTLDMINWIKTQRPVGTSKSYNTYGKQFQTWCLENGEVCFPASPTTVARWLRYLHEVRKLASGTITKSASAAVADMYKFSGLVSPTLDPLVAATRRIIRAQAKPRKRRLPLTALHLSKIVIGQTVKSATYLSVRNLFLIILMFACMMRSAEAVALKPGDVWLDVHEGEEVLNVFIEKSKTDQERIGHSVILGKAKQRGICPIFWFKLFKALANPNAKALFHQGGKVSGLAPASVNHILKALLDLAGIHDVNIELLTSHSCRIGGATAAAAAGVALRLIMRHGNWKSYSVFLYIRDSMADRLSVSQSIL
jgi:site-specific recombinase XerD